MARFKNDAFEPTNDIEKTRNATLSIARPWGATGSGFIIDNRCNVVTSRHVLEIDDSMVDAEQAKIKTVNNQIKNHINRGEAERKNKRVVKSIDITTDRRDFTVSLIDGTESVCNRISCIN